MARKQTAKSLKNKLDKLIQQKVVSDNPFCLVCGKETTVAHHYYPKSTSSRLRWYEPNLIPLCHGCHMQHHNGNPEIHNRINEIKGDGWLLELKFMKEQIFKPTMKELKEILGNLQK